jgi:hypothetical protein
MDEYRRDSEYTGCGYSRVALERIVMDWVKKLQSELRTSEDLVSTFFLAKSPAEADRAIEKLKLLSAKGVSPDYIVTITAFVQSVYLSEYDRPDHDFRHTLVFFFRPKGSTEGIRAFLAMKRFPQGIEIEVGMPGIIASSFPEFFENGFWTAFMPPGFYGK